MTVGQRFPLLPAGPFWPLREAVSALRAYYPAMSAAFFRLKAIASNINSSFTLAQPR